MAASATNTAWLETCLITVTGLSLNDFQFAGITENIDMDIGEKDIEQIVLTNGGRVVRFVPEGLSTVTMDMYPLEAGTLATAAGNGTGVFDLLHAKDANGIIPQRITNTRSRTMYRVLFLWTNDSAADSAADTITADKSAIRIGLANGYFTAVKASFQDQILKFSVTYKTAPFDKSGNSQVMMESCAGSTSTDILPAIAAYTSTTTPFA